MEQDFYITLIYKQLRNLLGPEEERQLAEWLADSEENQALSRSISLAWENSEAYQLPEVELDLNAEFDQMLSRLEGEEKRAPAEPPSYSSSFRWWSIAAAILVLLIFGYLWNINQAPDTDWIEITQKKPEGAYPMPDGSIVWVREGSTLRYPTSFSGKERRIFLSGEAYLEVQPDTEKPFFVETASGQVRVLGTVFTVKAWEKSELLEVYVQEGKVELAPKDVDQTLTLERQQKGVFNISEKNLYREEGVSENEIAWRTKVLTFEDTPLEQVIQVLEQRYQVDLELENGEMSSCPLSLMIESDEIGPIFENLTELFGIKVVEKGPSFYVLQEGLCP